MDLRAYIRNIPDFPKPGIVYRDITPLLADAVALQYAVDRMRELCEPLRPDVIVSVEARGFVFAAPLAYGMGKPFVPVRKQGKLPHDTHSAAYDLEYGSDTLEIHMDAIADGQSALIVDDLLATGGTMSAAGDLVRRCGGLVAGHAVIVELAELEGRERLGGNSVVSLITYR